MKIKDLFTEDVYIVCIKRNLTASNFISLCKHGIRIEVVLIGSRYYCSLSAYFDNTACARYHIALFPVRSSFTSCQLVNLCLFLLHDMGYIKGSKDENK